MMALLAVAVSKGLNLQTNTPVLSTSDTPDLDGNWTVKTPRGTIKASNLVLATNAYTAGIAPQYTNRIIPSRGICSRIVVFHPTSTCTLPSSSNPPTSSPPFALTATYAIIGPHNQADYLIPRPDASFIIGGARSTFFHDRSHWYNCADDSSLILPARTYFDGYMQRTFTGWEDSGAVTDKVWTGIMGYTSDLLPHLGAVPNKPGQFIAAGFNGHGMPVIFLAAKGIAQMVSKGADYEDTGLPRLFKTTKERLDSEWNEWLEPKLGGIN